MGAVSLKTGEYIRADLRDADAAATLVAGVDAVIHTCETPEAFAEEGSTREELLLDRFLTWVDLVVLGGLCAAVVLGRTRARRPTEQTAGVSPAAE